MKKIWTGFFMSFGMFCAIPSPYRKWDDTCINLVLPCFPLVGMIIGLVWYSLSMLVTAAPFHQVPVAALITLIPFFLTGFIHLDGFMDTSDALLSRRPLEDQLRILKDPHTGAFAVIMLISLFLMSYGAIYAAVDLNRNMMMLVFLPIASRCFTALALIELPPLTNSGYGALFKKDVGITHRVFIIVVLICVFLAAYFYCGLCGLLCLVLSLLGFIAAVSSSFRRLRGISGDLSGHALVICELCGIMAWALL